MDKNKLSIFSAIISIISVAIALVAVSLQLKDISVSVPIVSALVGAAIAAAIGAFFKLFVSRSKTKRVAGRIFLAYAREDKDKVEDLNAKLTEAGFSPWFDLKEILPGQNWQESIIKAIRNSDVVLACLSKKSISKTGFVQKELKLALDELEYRKEGISPVIPVRLEETEVPGRLSQLQWVNLYEKDGINTLIKALSRAITVDEDNKKLPNKTMNTDA